MEVIIRQSGEEASLIAARIVRRLVRSKPAAALGLATGGTPVSMYAELCRMHREERLDFSRVTTFNLDEYVGLGPDHPCSYHAFMKKHLFKGINVRPDSIHIPDGLAPDVPAHCAEYEQLIQDAGGIDLQVLGIGSDGHLGFNEPSSSLASRTRFKTLTSRTREDNARFFNSVSEVPWHVITMGIGTILESRACLVMAFGTGKADAVAAAVEGPVSASVPASALQLHAQVHMLIDEAAASKLRNQDYYRWVYDHRPEWQKV